MQTSSQDLTPIVQSAQNRCFGCGPANSGGLHLEFQRAQDGSVVSLATVTENFEGPHAYLHGGIIATMLDESMAKAVQTLGVSAMTSRMEVDYLRPVPSGKPIRLEGRLVRSEGRTHWAEAKVMSLNGHVLAQSKGKFIQIRPRLTEKI